jgi:hypothetical protein
LLSPAYVTVSVLAPGVRKVSGQLPPPAAIDPPHVGSPATLELTEYVPVGVPFPLTEKVSSTGDLTTEGFGVSERIAVVLAAFAAVTICVAEPGV